MSNANLQDALAFLRGTTDFASIMRIANEAKRRLAVTSIPTLSAGEVKTMFKVGKKVEIHSLRNDAINGAIATVTDVLQTNITVDVSGYITRIPAQCAIPLDDEEASASVAGAPALPVTGDRVRLLGSPTAKHTGTLGVIVGTGKRYKLRMDNGLNFTADRVHFDVLPRPEKDDALVILWSNETGDRGRKTASGPALLVHTRVTSLADAQKAENDATLPGTEAFGWLTFAEAEAFATARGATVKRVPPKRGPIPFERVPREDEEPVRRAIS